MQNNQSYQVVKTACDAGSLMLQSGAEVHRVEHMINSICHAYGVFSIQCSVAPTVITAGFFAQGQPSTYITRIEGLPLNLHRVELINDLSRSVSKAPPPLEQLQQRLDEIKSTKPWHWAVTTLAAGCGTGAFALVFGGIPRDFICGFCMGALLHLLMLLLARYGFQDLFSRFLGGAAAALLGGFFVYIGLGSRWELLTVSALTLLFPGLLFTNSFRDVATGDFVSAITHAVEAFGIAAALAGGSALVHGIFSRTGVFLP